MSKLRVRIGILSIALLSMCGIVITPVFSEIIQAFPKVPATTIQMIGSLPSLGQLIISLVVGRLAMSIPKKRLALIGVTSVIIGGIVPIFWHSQIAILLVCAFVVGIGVGFVSTLTPMLISIFFKGEARASMMGFNTAFNSLGAVLMMSAAGILGSKMWFHSYYVFLLAVLVFFLVLFMLPLDKVEKVNINSSKKRVSTVDVLKQMNKYVFAIAGLVFLTIFFYTAFSNNLSILISQKQVGGTSLAGILSSFGTLGGMITGFLMVYIRKIAHKHLLEMSALLLAVSYFVMFLSDSIPVLFIGAYLSGMGMCIAMATAPYEISILTNEEQNSLGMSLFIFANALGGIVSPIILGWFKVTAGLQTFLVIGIAMLLVALIMIFFNFSKKVSNQCSMKASN